MKRAKIEAKLEVILVIPYSFWHFYRRGSLKRSLKMKLLWFFKSQCNKDFSFALREKCPRMEKISTSIQMWEKMDLKNSTFDHFSRIVTFTFF